MGELVLPECKVCKTCGKFKSFGEFYKDKRNRDGCTSECKICRSATMKRYHDSDKGQETIKRAHKKRKSFLQNKTNFTQLERRLMLNRDNWTCKCCGIKVHDKTTGNWNTHDKAHIDHIIPVSKGGNSEPSNLRVLCRTCNLMKGNKQDEKIQIKK